MRSESAILNLDDIARYIYIYIYIYYSSLLQTKAIVRLNVRLGLEK